MSGDRLPAGLEAASIVRRAQSAGDFAVIVKRGDADRGSIVIIVTSRGRHIALLERTLGADGCYSWNPAGPPESAESAQVASFLEKRARFDPDYWAIELDIANPERFIAETTSMG
ncbi:MAG: DUF1491 family protein [Sphingomicrobium sp.]